MRILLPVFLAALFACKRSDSVPAEPSAISTGTDTVASTIIYPDTAVTVLDTRMAELSGIAVSRTNPGTIYVHNDSGDSSRFFALSPTAQTKATIYFNGDPAIKPLGVVDCEDMAVAQGADGQSYVYIGDIGDNNAIRKYIRIYRIQEPKLPKNDTTLHLISEPLTLRYPDGAHDAETLMADPVDRLLYIITKREDSVSVYTAPLDFKSGDTVQLSWHARLFFPGFSQTKWVTGGSISKDGSQVLLKTYVQVIYWKRTKGTPVWKALQAIGKALPYTIEPQGEAIAFTVDGKGYYTISEGKNPKLYHYYLP